VNRQVSRRRLFKSEDEEQGITFRIFVGNVLKSRPLSSPRWKWKDDIKTELGGFKDGRSL